MLAKKKSRNNTSKISISYISLILGILTVLIAGILISVFSKNQTYDKINTAISIFEKPKQTPTPQPKPKQYEVKEGDNLWNIAEKVYGSGYNWVDLAKTNNLKNPDLLEAGTKLALPDVKKITAAINTQTLISVRPITTSSYTVVKGDNLWNISIRKYGDGYKWPEVAKVNNIANPDLIYANTMLKLP